MMTTLLSTKLFTPVPRANLVTRPRLLAHLDEGLHRKLTLISAPAGFGKTTLVTDWIRGQKGAPETQLAYAWLSLDEKDNQVTRFLTYFIAAFNHVEDLDRTFVDRSTRILQSSQPPPIEPILIDLINEIANIPGKMILVLDDYHLIDTQSIHDTLSFLLEHQPPQLHLILTTRAEPPLPLAHLRVQGQLTELRFQDLRFTSAEASEFLNKAMGLNLTTEQVRLLETRTEGWIAGLQMAAISIQGQKRKSDFILAFSGSHHFVLDYLVEEVIEQQPPNVQEFLLKTAVLKQLTADLCNAVTGGEDSHTILTQLEQANLFLVPLDEERRWFRYHQLFLDLLNNILRQRKSTGQIRELHQRAGKWHQDNGALEEAMFHAMAARNFEQAAMMIEKNTAGMFLRSEVPVLLGWIEKLPEEIVYSHPWIDIYRANTLALASQLDEVDDLLDGVEMRVDPGAPDSAALLGHIAAIRAYAANLRGDSARVIAEAKRTKHFLPEPHLIARGMAAYALADTCFAGDDMASASQELQDMHKVGQHTGQLMLSVPALCDLAAIRKVQGRLNQAEDLYSRAHRLMVENKGLDSRVRCSYEFGLADLLRERNQLEAAHEHATIGIDLRQRLGGFLVSGDLVMMRILQARGDVEGALEMLENAEKYMRTYPFQIRTTIEFKTARVIQSLAVGDTQNAILWAGQLRNGSEPEQIARARLQLALGDASGAQRALERQQALAEAGSRNGRLIEILGLQAIALKAQSQVNEAAAALSQALSLARPEGYQRIFLDMGQPLCDFLAQLTLRNSAAKSTSILDAFVRDLLAAFQTQDQAEETTSLQSSFTEGMIDPLTDRELEVLRLLNQGLSNKQIASRLVVAPSTIKQHLKHIYSKLDVHSRIQAVARGRELNLL